MKITKFDDIKDITKFTGICIEDDGTKTWYKDGKYHRKDGHAIEWYNGDKYWLKNGKLHREDGPAVENTDGAKEWWLNDTQYTREQYYKKLYKLGKISEEELFLELL